MPTNVSESKNPETTVKLDKPKWLKVDGDTYKVDHVINAYLTGKESALKDLAKTIERQKEETLVQGMELVDSFVEKLDKELNIGFSEARLKQIDLFNIESLIILDQEIYLSDKLDEIYSLYFEFEDNIEFDFDFEVKFTFNSKNLNKEQLKLDGFEYFRN